MLAALLLLTVTAAEDPVYARHVKIKVHVSSPQAPSHSPNHPFQATKILNLEFGAGFEDRLSGPHVVEFKIYTPKGKLYQVLTSPFTGTPGGAHREGRRVEGYPRALREQEMREEREDQRPGERGAEGREGDENKESDEAKSPYNVTADLPVAGTWIITNSLYGRWRADAYLDDRPLLSGTTHFSIEP
jgi:hypothetical protein